MPATFERNQVGKREDLADSIYNIDAKDYPAQSLLPKDKELTNTKMTWQADAYDAPNTEGVVDGADVSTYEDAAENRALLENHVQMVRRTPMVTVMAQDVSKVAGVVNEMAGAIKKKTVEAKRDVESVICSDNEAQADNGTVPYKTRGLGKWIQATAQSYLPVPEAFRTPSASIDATALANVTKATVNGVMASQYAQTGQKATYPFLCGTKLKARFTEMVGYQPTVANFTAVLRTERGEDSMAYQDTIESFTGDFGTYDLILSNWLGWNNATKVSDARRGYALDPKMLALRFNKKWAYRALPDLGGGPRGLVETILGLVVKNPLGLAAFKAVADS